MTAPFVFPIRIYWEDTDAGGIVFYANYLKFFERARTEWLRSLGIQQQSLKEQSGGMFVVSETQIKYFSPARLDDLLEVTAQTAEAGRASLVLAQQAWLTLDGERKLLAEGTIRIGWVDRNTLKPGRIPAAILEALQ
ncbi:MAG: tol-pal system-associated acyl-CoA thioesterase [Betaproteobacteria bacterium]|jgi:acyl-CoA thioester hydrolase|nr:tol-pal system-associated acyl-CoA thioesterase [Betaproteobacteria bacterium]NBZ98681.1 tol-pal system-associated acyl-CoA thioesterase [Betaproteobacteria bacterium]NDB43936.1 tol-pal system-associated acyl-CoA thioesterase [Betaproteobacteria bacterium]NDD01417.1 tol-pal system-associated acyl-CoA thioesterase [Betaproteobacteria bacterium]NDD23518.1 tol-pal system-associated acyl-CoA thioesterase [Betaproteobacteria bacterium]